ncbi:hypothetical protein TSTA_050240 [Talaromyces stipitatus ATCC 10500]|uniref:Uncharacterized protein n=1 Tax=Talaromyces stipitatus (strain ATCC 10500 / CBS 375.48 / QM 6759 / NRRL 1006) TaxID=441959 RepID=B8MIS2_TALSN|nr:uncharacterized protein TSTA_050240 [Talaromyces stipitatus ATCC 10500]EED15584.1 hypothetical protein TSTA_050240 [Talaromyces stipitatus ATCC 10500]
MNEQRQIQPASHDDNDDDDDDAIEWGETAPPLIQDLYRFMIHKERAIHAFHLWLRLLEHNLMPNVRDSSVHYHTVHSLNDDYNLVRISLNANPDKSLNRKMRIQVLAFSLASSASKNAGVLTPDGDESEDPDERKTTKIPWNLFLRDLRNQHISMHEYGDPMMIGDYDCFIAYKQYARLYTVQQQYTNPEAPIIKECWVNFGLPPLWKDSNDQGPLLEFKTHFALICQLLRAFAWNINIPYVYH